jgi:PAS domain S-box-containing protein
MPGRTTRILLVEDNPGDARYIREMLRDAAPLEERTVDGDAVVDSDTGGFGVGIDSDRDGEIVHESRLGAALDHLDTHPVDVVLLDLDLPDSDGLETLRSVLDHDETVPVIVLTGISDRDFGVEALREGAAEFLVKDEINPGLLVRSIHHAIERRAHRREQKLYETLIEESMDVNAVIDRSGTFEYVTPSTDHVLGYDSDSIVGENAFDFIHPDDEADVREEFDRLMGDPDYHATVDFRFEHADGSWVYLNARGRNLLDEPEIGGLVVYTRDVTEQRRYERRLETQRQRLAALNQLNGVVHGVTEAVIDQSTRDEIEQIACERLAESDSYEFAWVGEPDFDTDSVDVRAEAGTGDYTDQLSLSIAADSDPDGPTARALRTGEIQTVLDVYADPDYEPWRDLAEEYGFQSSAAIPIRHENTTYGVLNVYADRPDAFREQERTVVEHLGRLVGHAISAAKRKRALMSDSVVELEFRVGGVAEGVDEGLTFDEPVTLEQTIPVQDGDFLVYGTTPSEQLSTLEGMADTLSYWESVTELGEQDGDVRFELQVSDPPLMSKIASLGGSIEQVVVSDDVRMTVHLPQDVETRQVVDAVQEEHDSVEAIAHRQVSKTDDREERVAAVWGDEFTERQRTVVETAYYAGFFEWPRATSGEEVAEKLGISGPTFSQHLRAAENKLFGRLVGGDQSGATGEGRETEN